MSLRTASIVGLHCMLLQVSCATGPPVDGAVSVAPKSPITARDSAVRDPCRLLAAIMKAGSSTNADGKDQGKGEMSGWSVRLKPGCCEEGARIDRRPVVMSFDPGGPELIGWGRSCDGDVGGPKAMPNATVSFYYVNITAKGEAALVFDVTPAYVAFDGKGTERTAATQGCPDFNGEAQLAIRVLP